MRFPLSGLRALPLAAAACALALTAAPALAQQADKADKRYAPVVGQMGKDSVWVPTPHDLIERMLDLAKLTPKDVVIDLGSGDGRMIIAAAKRGARAIGVEWDQGLVDLSDQTAKKEGVADKAEFVRHDMFTYDISKATVMALFMLPDQMEKLTPKFLDLRPGTRIVINTFRIPRWPVDVEQKPDAPCTQWCTALLYIVPAKVEGTWRLDDGELTLKQEFQMVSGTLNRGGKSTDVKGRLNGEEITFEADGVSYTGRVSGNAIAGEAKGAKWTAVRK